MDGSNNRSSGWQVAEWPASQPQQTSSRSPRRDVAEHGEQPNWKQIALSLEQLLAATTRPYFSGSSPKRALEFLNEFEEFFKESYIRSSDKLKEVLWCLKRSAKEWATANGWKWQNFDDFRSDFVEFFWPLHRRWAEAEKIQNTPYDPNHDGWMVDFFIRGYGALHSLLLSLSEKEILSSMMKLFGELIWEVWCKLLPREKTFFRAQEFLLSFGPTSLPRRRSRDASPPRRRRRDDSPPRRRRREVSPPRQRRRDASPTQHRRRDASPRRAATPTVSSMAPFDPFSLPPPNVLGNARRMC
ncbi:hypothetical protein Zmor_014228 [Zophobas morio]|uniref:Uncharacterized protein n=1 Tax=Zophobas morio TaxID=2755281 RepID=A0AA38MGD2_9CUCU|nr:hypothetical protein Zmor_014228 [Zophobas morio]